MSLFPSTLTGLDDGETPPPVIELQGISAGQLSLVLTQYTPLETTTANTAAIGVNAAASAAGPGRFPARSSGPRAVRPGSHKTSILTNASGLAAVNTSLTLGLSSKANQSALDALQVEVDGKSTAASVDLKLANHPTTAAMNSSIASANNATLATVATTYALKSVVDQLALDVAARRPSPRLCFPWPAPATSRPWWPANHAAGRGHQDRKCPAAVRPADSLRRALA